MKTVKFWTRVSREKSEEWKLVEGGDRSGVPLGAWKTLNKQFWARRMRGEFYPLDELEAYQIACGEMVRACGRAKPRTASLTTYLVGAAFNNLNKFKERAVDRARTAYRAVCERGKVAAESEGVEARGEDRDDREWTERGAKSLNVQAYVEGLAGEHSAARLAQRRRERREAKAIVWTTLARLGADAQRGLRAWLAADGIWVDAARLYNPQGSVQGYVYRFRHLWAKEFKGEGKRKKEK